MGLNMKERKPLPREATKRYQEAGAKKGHHVHPLQAIPQERQLPREAEEQTRSRPNWQGTWSCAILSGCNGKSATQWPP